MNESIFPQSIRAIVAVESLPLREQLETVLREGGFSPTVVPSVSQLRRQLLTTRDLVFLETGGDAAKMVQVVNDLYKATSHTNFRPAIVGIASLDTIRGNPTLDF